MITMRDFWSTLKSGNITIFRENMNSVSSTGVSLQSGASFNADFVINCTGWGDHFGFLSSELKDELGIPQYGSAQLGPTATREDKSVDPWELHDKAADDVVAQQLPLLADGPRDRKPQAGRLLTQRRWRLYNRCIPLANARKNDRSIVVLGQIHTTQTPTIAEIQSLWAIVYMLGEVELPEEPTMIREIAEWNAWTRKRYLGVGERYPYALFDWIPYLDRLLGDLRIKTRRNGTLLADFLTPYGPHCYAKVLQKYVEKRRRSSAMVNGDSSLYNLESQENKSLSA
jgi:dimethylaniline monooxygenase (N-oxide forming)